MVTTTDAISSNAPDELRLYGHEIGARILEPSSHLSIHGRRWAFKNYTDSVTNAALPGDWRIVQVTENGTVFVEQK